MRRPGRCSRTVAAELVVVRARGLHRPGRERPGQRQAHEVVAEDPVAGHRRAGGAGQEDAGAQRDGEVLSGSRPQGERRAREHVEVVPEDVVVDDDVGRARGRAGRRDDDADAVVEEPRPGDRHVAQAGGPQAQRVGVGGDAADHRAHRPGLARRRPEGQAAVGVAGGHHVGDRPADGAAQDDPVGAGVDGDQIAQDRARRAADQEAVGRVAARRQATDRDVVGAADDDAVAPPAAAVQDDPRRPPAVADQTARGACPRRRSGRLMPRAVGDERDARRRGVTAGLDRAGSSAGRLPRRQTRRVAERRPWACPRRRRAAPGAGSRSRRRPGPRRRRRRPSRAARCWAGEPTSARPTARRGTSRPCPPSWWAKTWQW